MPEEMTLFYMLKDGKINGFCTGKQSMKYFGEYEEEYSKIMGFIIVKYDKFVLNNLEYYRIKDKKLKFLRDEN